MEFILQMVFVLLLILLNGFFVASEFSLVAVRRTRIDELAKKGNRAAKLDQKALKDLDSYISATQLGITIASLALGWVGEPILANFFEPFFSFLPKEVGIITSHTLSVGVAFCLITFLHIVLGELAPKTIALQKSEAASLIIIAPLLGFATIFKPFIWVLNVTGNLVVKVLGVRAASEKQMVHSEEEIRMLLTQSEQSGVIPKDEVEMVHNVFRLGEIPVKHIMIPRTDIIAFSSKETLKEVANKIVEQIHSRFPVYENSIDNIVGFIHIKDIYKCILKNENLDKKLSEANIIREIINVPETKKADDVLVDMRKRWIHMAIVNDEYGGTEGIVTLEDIIESLVGEIQDEFDRPLTDMKKQADGSYLVDGTTEIDRIRRTFNIPLRGQGYSTIAGLIFGILGREPRIGDKLQIGDIVFIIEAIEKKRIKTIRIRREKRRNN